MTHTLAQDRSLDAPSSRQVHVLASLALDRTAPRQGRMDGHGAPALIHLGQLTGERAEDQAYALGLPVGADGHGRAAGAVDWRAIGSLDVTGVPVERILAAGLSVVALNYVRASGVQISDAVLVLGDTAWSLLVLQWARLQGASPLVFACKGSASLAEVAASTGAELVIADAASRDLVKAAKATPRAVGFAVALDGIVSEPSLALALPALRDAGRYVFAALEPEAYASFNAYPDLHRRDIEMVSPIRMPAEMDLAAMLRFSLQLAEQGRLRLDDLLKPSLDWPVKVARNEA